MSAVSHLALRVCADVNAQLTMQVDQDLVEESTNPLFFSSDPYFICMYTYCM